MEDAFIERGRPATFVAELRALATALDAAAEGRQIGLFTQVGATTGPGQQMRCSSKIHHPPGDHGLLHAEGIVEDH